MSVIWIGGLVLFALQMLFVICEDEPTGNEINNLADTGQFARAQVYFKLYSPESDVDWIPICMDNSSEYLTSVFYIGAETKFIVHGWLSSESSITVNYTANEYKAISRGNIVKVDWSRDASWRLYPISAYQVSYIGEVVATFINKLIEIGAVDLKSLHLIGHSLGAHVMGNAGSMIKSGKPSRITGAAVEEGGERSWANRLWDHSDPAAGLDPAKPGFEGLISESGRLDPSDADFVDVIHSAAGAAGYYQALGHVDFYPNGGSPPQPGCFEMFQPRQIGCSHGRSYMYFIESISNPTGFPAIQCGSWKDFKSGACENNTKTYMGDATPSDARGVYYLETNSESPFAKGERALRDPSCSQLLY